MMGGPKGDIINEMELLPKPLTCLQWILCQRYGNGFISPLAPKTHEFTNVLYQICPIFIQFVRLETRK